MDPVIAYLLIVNVVALFVYALDFCLCQRYPRLGESFANALVLDAFPLLGGAVGTLLALGVFGGLGKRHRMNKDNIQWWFLAFACLVVWVMVVCVRLNVVELDLSAERMASGWDEGRLKVLCAYLVVVNALTFSCFVWDKRVARSGTKARRLPEALLLGLGFVGGSLGGLVAMRLSRHKTLKWYFVWGLPCFLVLGICLVLFAHLAGYL